MESSFYPYISAFAWIGILLLLGTFLRAKVKFLQTTLFPASLIGGVIGFFLINAGLIGIPTSGGWKPLNAKVFSMITFHLFAFSFVGIGMLQVTKSKSVSKTVAQGGLWTALVFCLLFASQALLGEGVFAGWKGVFGGEFFTKAGYLLGAGFTQGPGQTQAYATIWENTYKIANVVNLGLAFSAVGFLVSAVVGVPLAHYGIRKGWITSKAEVEGGLPRSFLRGIMDKGDNPPAMHATTHSANIDSFAFHFALMATIYGIAYLLGLLWFSYMPKGINGLGFGYMFLWSMGLSALFYRIAVKGNFQHMVDNETVRRFVGTSVDFMICAVFLGVQVKALQGVAVPFLLACIGGAVITLAICMWFGRRSPEFGFERGLCLFGHCTGTASSGLLLLRIVDPKFETTVAMEIAAMNAITFFIFKPISWCMPFVPVEGFPMIWIFLGFLVVSPIALFMFKLVRKPAF